MADQVDELNGLLDEHANKIQAIETAVSLLAVQAAAAVDPTRLQAMVDRVKNHTTRLAALLSTLPVVK